MRVRSNGKNSMASGNMEPALAKRARSRAQALRCGVCLFSNYHGQKQVPRLAGQREDYLVEALRAYRDGERRGGDTLMTAAMHGVSNQDIAALAHYLSRLP